MQQLLGSIDADLLLRVLERALDEGNIPVILAATQALGDRGEVRAARASVGGAPQGVTRALYFPDRRVQLAAVKALLRMPASNVPVASARVVEVLRRLLLTGSNEKAVVAYLPADRFAEVRQSFKAAGLEPVFVNNIKEAFDKPATSADIDVVFLHPDAGKELPFAIAQIRGHADQGRVPIFLLSVKENERTLQQLAARHPNVKVMPEVVLTMEEELKNQVEAAILEAYGAKVTAAERKEFAKVSLDYLWRMARNEITGYDVRPALDAIVAALRSPDTATEALEILARLPGTEPQARLAGVVLDPGRDKLRIPAAMELNHHIQKYGVMLDKTAIGQVQQAYTKTGDPQLKAQLAITLGALRPSAQLTGSRLIQFRSDPPPPPAPMPPQKKDDKDGP